MYSDSSHSFLSKISWGQTWTMHIKLQAIVHCYNHIMCYVRIFYAKYTTTTISTAITILIIMKNNSHGYYNQ